MASLTIRNLDESLKARLRIRAAHHGRSMEEEARTILRTVLAGMPPASDNLAAAIRRRVGPLGGIDLPEIARDAVRSPPRFDE